jgi:predicted lipid-binding transport protein (Tim44 family)
MQCAIRAPASKVAMPLDPLTIVFAIVAIVVIWKLRSVLGQRNGFEKPPRPPFFGSNGGNRPAARPANAPNSPPQGNVVRLPGAAPAAVSVADPNRWRGFAEPGSSVANGLDAIAAADPSFSAGPFLDGAKTAYEAIVTAFAAGERKTLQNLLSREVYDGFNTALIDREKRKERLTTTFVSMDDATFEAAGLETQLARITVRFRSKQISATHGSDGTLTDGSPDRVVDMNDLWTFAREVKSRDPNWKLVATESGH